MASLQWREGKFRAALKVALLLCVLVGPERSVEASDEGALWEAVRNGVAVAIMRHALAPGTGDPDNFVLGDCSAQRNLSDAGRRQATEIGDRFRENGIQRAHVFTSEWCRCRDTAELLGLGPVKALPPLNSFFERWENRDTRTAQLRAWLADYEHESPLVLVTHQVNIRALTGNNTSSGQIVVMRWGPDGSTSVLGTL